MAGQFSIFISHLADDESIASCLKDFLEKIFLNADVFIASRDLKGGEIWVKEIRDCLKHATVILPVITRFSHAAPWVLFEAGVGFVDSRTIPVCGDGITPENLEPPLKLLQARKIDDPGLRQLAGDIAKHAEVRQPSQFPGLTEALQAIEDFLGLRGQPATPPPPAPLQTRVPKALPRKSNPYDPVIKAKHDALCEKMKRATIETIVMAAASYDVPSRDELNLMEQRELDEIVRCFNLPQPLDAHFKLLLSIPRTNDSKWKKLNAENSIRQVEESLSDFLAELDKKRKGMRHAD